MLFERAGFWSVELTESGIFFVHIRGGVQSVDVLEEFMVLQRPHLERLAPVLFMNDASDAQNGPLTMQWRLAQHMRANAKLIARSGVFGLSPSKAFVVRSLARAANRDNLRVFDSRVACEAWLLEGRASVSPSTASSGHPHADPPR